MSMLSAQCDELRNLAGDGSVEFVAGPIRADVLRMAADTIWELRCKLNDEQEENEKLRELVRDMQRAIACLVVLGDAYVERHEDELCAFDDRVRELGVSDHD